MFPHYCPTYSEAEKCADEIAKSHGLINKTIIEEKEFSYENEELILLIRIFPDNWHGSTSCYSFSGGVARKDILTQEGLPFNKFERGQFSRQQWRKVPSYFASDISQAIINLNQFDKDGKIEGVLYEWRTERGFGFAKCHLVSKVFLHIKDFSFKDKIKIKEGVRIKFNLLDEGRGPKGSNIVVL
ncbi:MAG: cold shock domain-containing protein [Melioribacteraceae bacterium]|nr:cold shock domain-containing protein [Melioribacteraceae bacterium]